MTWSPARQEFNGPRWSPISPMQREGAMLHATWEAGFRRKGWVGGWVGWHKGSVLRSCWQGCAKFGLKGLTLRGC